MKYRNSKRKAFSLIEVMISIVIIAIALAGVTSALVYGVKHSQTGREVSDSTQLARSLFEYMQVTGQIDSLGPGDWPDDTTGINDDPEERRLLNSSPFGGMDIRPDLIARYRRNISIERMSNDPNSHEHLLARVVVRVYWKESEKFEHFSEITGIIRHQRL